MSTCGAQTIPAKNSTADTLRKIAYSNIQTVNICILTNTLRIQSFYFNSIFRHF